VAHVSMSVIISCVSNLTLSLEEMIRALFLWLENETDKWLSVSAAVAREKAMPLTPSVVGF
jgi:hypothetical protein